MRNREEHFFILSLNWKCLDYDGHFYILRSFEGDKIQAQDMLEFLKSKNQRADLIFSHSVIREFANKQEGEEIYYQLKGERIV